MNKAYDRVNWLFLQKVRFAYGFPPHWITLIKECISTVSYRILINGVATAPFHPTCGLRQGDPLSPYLFLFCMDILSRMTSLATDIGLFQGIRLHRSTPYISHLFFADDAMFFFKATSSTCGAVATLIQRFCDISGQVINLQKSFVRFSPNTTEDDQRAFKQILRMDATSSMGTYLGIPIDIQGSKVHHFTPLLDKVSSTITKWNHINLSQSAKIIIISTILVGQLIHFLSIFKIPATITNKLDSLFAMFLWKDCHGRGIHWKKKCVIQRPKHLGGLGVRNVAIFNNAILMKKVAHQTKSSFADIKGLPQFSSSSSTAFTFQSTTILGA